MIKLDLSELPISPKQYKSAGLLLVGAGVFLLIIGLLFAIMTVQRRSSNAERIKISGADCMKKIQSINLKPAIEGDSIRIQETDLHRGMELLASSSQAAALCPNWILSDYCMGDACTPPGLSMTLKFQEKK